MWINVYPIKFRFENYLNYLTEVRVSRRIRAFVKNLNGNRQIKLTNQFQGEQFSDRTPRSKLINFVFSTSLLARTL